MHSFAVSRSWLSFDPYSERDAAVGGAGRLGCLFCQRLKRAGAAHREQIWIDAALLQERTAASERAKLSEMLNVPRPVLSECPVRVTRVVACNLDDKASSSFN
jgi:hypothetical protein